MRSCRSNGATSSLRRPWNWQMPVSRLNRLVASSPNSGRQVKQAEVGVEAGGGRVVVAGAQVDVAADAVAFAPDDQGSSWRGSCSRPGHRRRGRPASSSWRAHWMLLASSKRARNSTTAVTCLPFFTAFIERADDARVAARAIEGLLDGQHVRVRRRLLQETPRRCRSSRTGGAAGCPARGWRRRGRAARARQRPPGRRRAGRAAPANGRPRKAPSGGSGFSGPSIR